MNKLSQKELRNNLETAVLHNFIININKKPLNVMEEIWNERYIYFLNAILSHDDMPEGIDLKDIVNFICDNNAPKLKEYVEYLPGINLPLEKNKIIEPLALQNHGWMTSMFNNSQVQYERSITNDFNCTLTFKELNFFTLLMKKRYIHIKSNTSNILDFDWTIISVENEVELSNKNINLKDEKYIKYYIENYEDLSHYQEQHLTSMIDMLII